MYRYEQEQKNQKPNDKVLQKFISIYVCLIRFLLLLLFSKFFFTFCSKLVHNILVLVCMRRDGNTY